MRIVGTIARTGSVALAAGALLLILAPVSLAGVLVLAPHPDDDIITAAGVIYHALARGDQVQVAFMTNGDVGGTAIGFVRQNEAVESQVDFLGMIEDDLIFLGYPDGGLDEIYRNYTLASDVYLAPNGQSSTYGSRGLGRSDYHTYLHGLPADYNRPNMVGDLADLLAASLPDHIFVTGIHDTHSDHYTTYHVMKAALDQVSAGNPGYNPMLHTTIVWCGDENWPNLLDPFQYFEPIPTLEGTGLVWEERESLDVMPALQSQHYPENAKYQATGAHVSQGGLDGYLGRFIHKDEFFWVESHSGLNQPPRVHAGFDQTVAEGVPVQLDGTASFDGDGDPLLFTWEQVTGTPVVMDDPTSPSPTFSSPSGLPADEILTFALTVQDGVFTSFPDIALITVLAADGPVYGDNLGPQATVTASTERTDSEGFKAVDGIIDGYPGDHTAEWITTRETDGAWIRFEWLRPVTIGKVILFDRPNHEDHIIEGVLEFDDGSAVEIHAVDNYGRSSIITFPARTVSVMTFRILSTGWQSQNIGLAEMEIYPVLASGENQPPVANAGADQSAIEGVPVSLDGRGSYDPDSDPLTYRWVQTGGVPVTLSDSASSTPSFTTPVGLSADENILFRLTVNDGFTDSAPASTRVTVFATASGVPLGANIAPQALATASTESAGTGQTAEKAIDLIVDGYPGDHTREWASQHEGVGAWLQLDWAGQRTIQRIVVHDRPNEYDHMVTGTLTFSDGAVLAFDAVPNDGTGRTIDFAPREVTGVRVTATRVGTQTGNVGLAELEVFESGTTGINRAPVADAGPAQSVEEGVAVQLDGSGSSDPDGDLLTLWWIQTAGTPAPLSDPSAVAPTFTAPTGLASNEVLVYQLTVNDGLLTSISDTVEITVGASAGSGALGANIAPEAIAVASTENQRTGQTAVKAIDGFVDGYPGDHTREWATLGEGPGGWIELSWILPRTVQRVVLYDRPNEYDFVEGGTLTFSNGSTIPVGPLEDAGSGVIVDFEPRTILWVRFTVDVVGADTYNAGLSEFEVFESAGMTPNFPPEADAGPDQTVDEAVLVQLDGGASTDPEGAVLSWLWSQTSGTAVTLSDPTSPLPTFTSPAGLPADEVLVFQLVVRDGSLDSAPDFVEVTVLSSAPPPPEGTNIALVADLITASSERAGRNQGAEKAVDGFIDGYPNDSTREWVTVVQQAGAWIELAWDAPRVVDRIMIYDRPNPDDHITACTVTFSDGSSLSTGALDNTGGGNELTFSARTITSVRLTVDSTSGSTWSIGLAELEVFETLN